MPVDTDESRAAPTVDAGPAAKGIGRCLVCNLEAAPLRAAAGGTLEANYQ